MKLFCRQHTFAVNVVFMLSQCCGVQTLVAVAASKASFVIDLFNTKFKFLNNVDR